MNRSTCFAVAITAVLSITVSSAGAKKPEDAGHGNQRHAPKYKVEKSHNKVEYSYFDARQSELIRRYFDGEIKHGDCPPGLAKKNNGCLPPGQAKKWKKGYKLPADVVYYDLPTVLLHDLGHTPAGQRLVRVGTDILLIAVGSGLVIDAVQDLGGLF